MPARHKDRLQFQAGKRRPPHLEARLARGCARMQGYSGSSNMRRSGTTTTRPESVTWYFFRSSSRL